MAEKVINTSRKPITFTKMVGLIGEYIDHIKYDRNFADTTVVGRKKTLLLFAKFAGKENLSSLLIRKFVRHVAQERKCRPRTVYDYLRDIKCFTKWLYFDGKAKEDYGYRIPSPKVPQGLPKRIPATLVEKIYTQPPPTKQGCTRIWKTYNFYFEFMAKTGLRKTEERNLKRSDFNFEDGTLHVFAKGRRDTYCLIPPDMKDRLHEWFEERELLPDDLVFIGRDGNPLDRESIRFALKLRARIAGIDQRVYPHLIRHFFATDLLVNGVDVAKVQRLMRHRRITSTQIYLDLVVEDLRDDLTKSSLIQKSLPKKPPAEEKKTVINIYNPHFYNPTFAQWYIDYFRKGGDQYAVDAKPAALQKP